MPFGLTNAPAVFMNHMNHILRDLPFVVVYLDDILVFSKDKMEHVEHVKQVLIRLRRSKFYAKLSKCDFFKSQIKFLGYIVSKDGIAADPDKVRAMKDYPIPTTVTDTRAFLGLANHFRKFIPNFSQIALPLTELTKGNVSKKRGRFVSVPWTAKCQESFEKLKQALCEAPVLALPDLNKPFTVITDASDFAMGAILEQDGRPIAYESRKFSPAEANYTTTDRELMAVIHALTVWRCYLEGPEFIIQTDHNPLVHLQTQKTLNKRQIRWSEFLQGYNFQWQYRPGASNPADPLSRLRKVVTCQAKLLSCLMVGLVRRHPRTPNGGSVQSVDVLKTSKHGYAEDPWFSYPAHTNRLTFVDGLYYNQGRLVLPNATDLRTSVIALAHKMPMGGHFGVFKTIQLLSRHFWWPNMHKSVRAFIKTCNSCQANKALSAKPAGLLMPLPIPTTKWHTVTMDFVSGLPKTPKGHDAVLVFTDKLTKMVHFVPTTVKCTAKVAAQLLLDHVIKLHGIPRVLISDRDVRFRSHLYREVVKHYGIEHNFSTAFHPQTDGQTERVNRVMEDYLRHYVNSSQSDWDTHLAMAEFAFNNATHESTNTTPFYLNYGFHPRTPLSFLTEKEKNKVALKDSEDIDNEFTCPTAKSFTETMERDLATATKWLEAAQQRQKANANRSRRHVTFVVGDKVLVSTAHINLQTEGTRKLFPRFIGPYSITKVINSNAYEVDIPAELKCHRVFNVSRLRKFYQGADHFPPPPPVLIQGEQEWYVECILKHRFRSNGKGRTTSMEFLVKWRGYDLDYNTWEPFSTVENCQALDDYLKLNPEVSLDKTTWPKKPKET
jgi:hypothetical protein